MSLLRFFIDCPECAYKVKNQELVYPLEFYHHKIKIAYLLGMDFGEAVIIFYDKISKRYVFAKTMCGNLKKIDRKSIKRMSKKNRVERYLDYINFLQSLEANCCTLEKTSIYFTGDSMESRSSSPKCIEDYVEYRRFLNNLDH